jgi:uncharacterized repeat protein (TIGR03847 family)
MGDLIEFDPVDALGAGAYGRPGERVFLIQARKGEAVLSVLVEKEQVALLATEASQFLDRLAEDFPEDANDPLAGSTQLGAGAVSEAEPLFRARLIGLGFDASRGLVLLELREDAPEEEDEQPPEPDDAPGTIARLYATRAQVRAMAAHGAEAVASGRPTCPLCDFPMDPDGHVCPRWN